MENNKKVDLLSKKASNKIQELIDDFLNKESGRSVALKIVEKDCGNSALYKEEFNNKKMPSASVIKILISIALYSDYSVEHIKSQVVKGRDLPITKYPPEPEWIKNGDEYSLETLCRMMLTISDNSASSYLMDYVGMESIERVIKRIGLKDTEFKVNFDDENLGL